MNICIHTVDLLHMHQTHYRSDILNICIHTVRLLDLHQTHFINIIEVHTRGHLSNYAYTYVSLHRLFIELMHNLLECAD